MMRRLSAALLALGVCCGAAAAPEKLPLLVVPEIAAPAIDGAIAPGEWDKSVSTGDFVASGDGSAITPATRVQLGCDDRNLFILYRCAELAGSKLLQTRYQYHDADIWYNDSVELIFRPDPDREDYFQFLADTLDQHYDAYITDRAGYNPVWKSAWGRDGDGWILEIAIPFSAITRDPVAAGSVWQADFFRARNQGAQLSAWAPVYGGHNQIKNFGYLCFRSAKRAALNLTAFAEALPEDIRNLDSDELKTLLARVAELKREIAAGDEAFAAAHYQSWRVELKLLADNVGQLVFAARHAASGATAVIQFGDAYSEDRPARTGAPAAKELKAGFMADEARDFAFNVTSIAKVPMNLRFSLRYGVEDGVNGGGFLQLGLPGYHTLWRTVRGVATKDGSIAYDVLTDNPGGVCRIMPGETVQVLLTVKAENPPPLVKGHLVVQAIDGSRFEPVVLPVEFTAAPEKLADAPDQPLSFGWDNLPAELIREDPEFTESHFKTLRDHGFNMVMISGFYRLPRPKADADGNLSEAMDFTRLEELVKAVGTKFDAYYFNVDIWEKNDLRTDLIGLDFFSPAYEKAFKQWLARVFDKFNELGISAEKLVVCPYDESTDKRAAMIARWIKEVNPQARVLIDCSSDNLDEIKELDKYTDIWMPHVRTLSQEGFKGFYDYLDRSGKVVMTYYYSSGNNEKLKSPFRDYALNFWICYVRNLRGLGYWASGQYYGDPWYRKSFTGSYDTAMMYPTEHGVLPARRLLGWRRGIQDFQLLKLAEQKLKASGDQAGIKTLREHAAQVVANPGDAALADQVRDECRTIVKR